MTDPERSVFPEGWTVRPATAVDTPQLAALEIEAREALVDARGVAALLAEQPAVDDWAALLFEQATLAEGGQLDDPAGFVKRINDLMMALSGK